MKESVPVREVVDMDFFTKPHWMKKKTVRAVKRKHNMWQRYLHTKHPNAWEKYKKARNQASHQSDKDRKDFENTLAKEIKANNKAFWRYANSIKRLRKQIPNLRKKDGSLTKSDEEKANVLNQQFTSVFTEESLTNPSDIDPLPVKTLLLNITVKEESLLKILKGLRIDKAAGPDDIHPYILKNFSTSVVKPLVLIFNLSLTQMKLPTIWKKAIVSPLYKKKGSRILAINYRPISLTSIPCKLLERIIINHIVEHIAENNFNSPNQHGFTPRKSTTSNLLEAMNVWSEALAHNLPVDILYLDLEKAFDKVPHNRLIKQLEKFGLGGNILGWIHCFLSERKQTVKVGTSSSEESNVISGVPQGSVMGPILFLMYVSDIPGLVNNFTSLFADDTKLFSYLLEHEQNLHSTSSLQEDLEAIIRWSESMQMKFNLSKCHSLHLGHNNPRNTYYIPQETDRVNTKNSTSYTYNIHQLEKVQAEKDLGVIVDEDLNFYKHIEDKVSKANRMIGIVRQTFKFMNKTIFKTVYKTLIRPHLEYACVIWSPHTKKYSNMIERVQRRATKLVPELRDLPYHDRLKELDLPTLSYRRTRNDLIHIFKITKGMLELDSDTHCQICRYDTSMLQPALMQSNRGHKYKYQIKHHQGKRNRFLTSRVLKTWNNLSEKTVDANTLNTFKNRLNQDPALPEKFANYM